MKTIAKMAIPMFLSAAINLLLTFIDTSIVGHLGVQALSATSAGSSLYSIYIQVVGSLIIGLQILGSQEIVKKGKNNLLNYFRATIWLMYLLVGLFILASIFFNRQLLALFAPPEILASARVYFFSRLPSLLFSPLALCLKTEYDLKKQTKVGFNYTLIVVVNDLILDLLFIYGFGWGVFGAGFSDSVAIFSGLCYLIRKNQRDGIFRIQKIFSPRKIKKEIFTELNQLNMPEVISTMLDYLGTSTLFVIISRIGVQDIAAGRISSIYINIIFTLSINIGTVIQILLGRNQVRNQQREIIRAGFQFSTLVIAPITVLAVLVPRIFIIPFTSNKELIQMLQLPLATLWMGLLFIPVITITTGILRSRKQNKNNMVVNVLATWGLQVPSAFLFCLILHLGIWGFVLSYLLYFSGRIVGNGFLVIKKERADNDQLE